jgi:hypothetical protein
MKPWLWVLIILVALALLWKAGGGECILCKMFSRKEGAE